MINNSMNVWEVRDLFLEKHPVVCHSLYDFGGFKIRVDSNSEELTGKLNEYYKEFISAGSNYNKQVLAFDSPPVSIDFPLLEKTPDPGKTKIKEAYAEMNGGRIVKKLLTGMVFVFGADVNIAAGEVLENDNQVINFVNNRYIGFLLNKGYLLFHAAGIIHNGKGLVFSGFSGNGKSSLALHYMSKGAVFLSNDRILVKKKDDGLIMKGIPKLPRINPGTIIHNTDLHPILSDKERRKFMNMPSSEIWDLEQKYDAFIDVLFGQNKFRLSSPMFALIILNWNKNNDPVTVNRANLGKRNDLPAAFMKEPGLFYIPENNKTIDKQAYLDLLYTCPVYEISGGIDFNRAIELLDNIL